MQKYEHREENKEWKNGFLLWMGMISMAVSMLLYGIVGGHLREAYKSGVFFCILLIFLWIILKNLSFEIVEDRLFLPFSLLMFGLTLAGVFGSVYVNTCFLWIGGCVLLSALFPTGIGVGFLLCFGCLFCFVNRAEVSYEVFMFLIGIVFCCSVSFFKKEKAVTVVVLLDLIFYILLFFLLTKGSRAFFQPQTFLSMAGLAAFLLAANFLWHYLYDTGVEI